MKRMIAWSTPLAAVTAVLLALTRVVDVQTKALASRLSRVREAKLGGLSLADAWWLSGRPAIAGGASDTEGQYAGEFILSESPGSRSRDAVTVLSGQNLVAGAVVGKVTMAVGKLAIPTVVGTGNGTMSLLTAGPEIEAGNYVVKCTAIATHGGTFSVTTPGGKALPSLTLTAGAGNTTAYTSRHINFSITDGSTDFAVNDTFTIAAASGAPTVVGTGNGTISGLSLGPDAKLGTYRVECIEAITNGGAFKVVSPDGDEVAVGYIVAGAGGTLVLSGQRQINLTITDSTTDFAVGDHFNVIVYKPATFGQACAWDPTTYDGRHMAAGVLYDAVNATAAAKAGVLVARDAEVRKADLQWGAAITAAQKDSAYLDLAALGIVAR